MTLGRWLLIHSLSISIVVMLGVGYLFKQELKLSEAYNQLLQIDSSTLVIVKDISNKEIEGATDTKVQQTSNKTVDIRKSSIAVVANEKEVKPSIVEVNEPNSSTLPVEDVISFSNNTQHVENKSQIEETATDYLLQAREAYWDKDYQYAIQLYSKEIIKNPNSADLYGELGNIYYSLNNYDIASVHYLKAGELFIQNQDEIRAKQVYDILMSIAPARAEMLLQLKNQQHQ